jgi:hypothetical protein
MKKNQAETSNSMKIDKTYRQGETRTQYTPKNVRGAVVVDVI